MKKPVKKNKKKNQNKKKKVVVEQVKQTEVIEVEKGFKENMKDHFLKYKQPYIIGVSFAVWFIVLLLLATVGQKPPYDSVAINIDGLTIAWYAIFILSGAIFAVILAYREAFFLDINRDHLIDGALMGVVLGIIGARLYYVIFDSVESFSEIFNFRGGGLAIHGGIIVGIIFVFFYTRIRKMNLFKVLDMLAVGFLIGQIIGRWGNFFNQEAYGGPMSASAQNFLKVILPSFVYNNMNIGGVFYHPTFFYESLWNLVGLILLLIIRRKRIFKIGDMIGLYLIWYGLGRGLLIEPFREDPLLFVGTFSSGGNMALYNRVNVVLSLTLFTIGGALFIFIKNKVFPNLPYYLDVVRENEKEALFLLSKEGKQKRKENKKK